MYQKQRKLENGGISLDDADPKGETSVERVYTRLHCSSGILCSASLTWMR